MTKQKILATVKIGNTVFDVFQFGGAAFYLIYPIEYQVKQKQNQTFDLVMGRDNLKRKYPQIQFKSTIR